MRVSPEGQPHFSGLLIKFLFASQYRGLVEEQVLNGVPSLHVGIPHFSGLLIKLPFASQYWGLVDEQVFRGVLSGQVDIGILQEPSDWQACPEGHPQLLQLLIKLAFALQNWGLFVEHVLKGVLSEQEVILLLHLPSHCIFPLTPQGLP